MSPRIPLTLMEILAYYYAEYLVYPKKLPITPLHALIHILEDNP
ncbi:hypothetical protein DSUL_140069 [Desulfovibrionales bacterium]